MNLNDFLKLHANATRLQWDKLQGQEQNILHTVTLTQVVKPSVHDAGFSSVNRLDLVSSQRPSWQPVVVVMPAIETLEPDFGTASQQPLCCSSVWTDSFDPLVVHPEERSTNIQSTVHADQHVMWWTREERADERSHDSNERLKSRWKPAH